MSNGTSIRISSEMTDLTRAESELMRRSMGNQVEYWARIGRAVERSGRFSYDKIKAALMGRLAIDELNEWEKPVFDEEHENALRAPGNREERRHADRLRSAAKAGFESDTLGD